MLSFDANRFRRHMEKVEDCKLLVAEKTDDALSRRGFQNEELRRAGEGPKANGVLYKEI